jgi:hypothetical protein
MDGTVLELWRWPVVGMAGERMPSVRVDGRGVGGDRIHAVLAGGEPVEVPGWTAAYPFNVGANVDPAAPPLAVVTSPRGRSFRWGDPRLRWALEDHLGRPVQPHRDLERLRPSTLVVAGAGADPAVPANLRLDLELPAGAAVLAFGSGVRVRLVDPPRDGVAEGRPLANGRIAEGEAATIVPA